MSSGDRSLNASAHPQCSLTLRRRNISAGEHRCGGGCGPRDRRACYDHIATPEHVVRWRWQTGDIAFWDNRATSHYAAADYDAPRMMHRITVAGDRPFGIAETAGPVTR